MCYVYFVLFVFFFKQKTAYEMRISDWSSDVCSSDLILVDGGARVVAGIGFQLHTEAEGHAVVGHDRAVEVDFGVGRETEATVRTVKIRVAAGSEELLEEKGRASGRERVFKYG